MEKWTLYVKPVYDALPWPFTCDWEGFLRNPQPLPKACPNVACPSLCDGLSETPTVPANLPRSAPRGQYRFAIYHDAAWIYAFLESADAEPVVSEAELRAESQLAGLGLISRALTVYSADDQTLFRFTHDGEDKPLASASAVLHGPHARPPAPWAPDWDFRVTRLAAAELACWRLARAALADAWRGDSLSLSLSRLCFTSLEAVAWGSLHVWSPRPDEAGRVRFLDRRAEVTWPQLERLDMDYDPVTETASFECRWSDLPAPEDSFAVPRGKGFPPRPVPWQSCSVRAAGAVTLLPIAETVRTPPMPLADGINRIQASTPAGPAVTLHLEKRSGFTLRLPDWLDPRGLPGSGLNAFPERLDAECTAALAAFDERREKGEPLEFSAWSTYHAASVGRAWRFADRNPRLLDLLREQADFALSLQREDGTFSGFHLRARAGDPRVRWQGGAYDSGPAGELYAVAARLLNDPRYKAASEKLLRAYRGYRVEFNHNYSAFALYHLAEHYRLTCDPEALEHGLYYCKTSAAANLLPLGFQGGHNYYTCYGSITLRGLCHFCSVLPESHPYHPVLRERCLRMGNQLLSRLQPDGLFDSCDRYFLGERQWSFGLFSLAFVAGPENIKTLDAAIRFMLHKKRDRLQAAEGWDRYLESDLILYMAHRDLLLEHEPIDPFSL